MSHIEVGDAVLHNNAYEMPDVLDFVPYVTLLFAFVQIARSLMRQ